MNSIVAPNVEAIIDTKCLKQSAVAAKAGYTKQQFNAMLKGRRIMRDEDIAKIIRALGVDANTLFGIEAAGVDANALFAEEVK